MPPAASPPPWQHLEDIACAYWQSEALFTALRLQIFKFLNPPLRVEELAIKSKCRAEELARLLPVLANLGLIRQNSERWQNTALADNFLVPEMDSYLGNFLLYRQYLQPAWQELTGKIGEYPPKAPLHRQQSYEERNFHYVQALDALAKIKAQEICLVLRDMEWKPPILDIGGGAGAFSRAMLKNKLGTGCLFELQEVISAAQKIYPDPVDWQDIETISGDFRNYTFAAEKKFGLISIGNFLHTYEPDTARQLLQKAMGLASTEAIILIHDYFPDQQHDRLKGQLYDINMMLNTYNGHCHDAKMVRQWLQESGWQCRVYNLPSDSALIIACN